MNLGVAYGQKRLIENALTSFESATRLDPDDATYHNNAAKTYEIKNSARLYY
jgi:cytochrome c-type biogenesis protein CcmH/NrfG